MELSLIWISLNSDLKPKLLINCNHDDGFGNKYAAKPSVQWVTETCFLFLVVVIVVVIVAQYKLFSKLG